MNLKKISLIFLFTYMYTIPVFSQEENTGLPFITNYDPEEYQAHIQNWDIDQDNRGEIFVESQPGEGTTFSFSVRKA